MKEFKRSHLFHNPGCLNENYLNKLISSESLQLCLLLSHYNDLDFKICVWLPLVFAAPMKAPSKFCLVL